jgi:hypothetical protein
MKPAMPHKDSPDQGVLVYCYYTYLAGGGAVVPVHSARPATLDTIESLSAIPVLESARVADPSQVSDLGFFQGAQACHHRSQGASPR